MKTYHIGKLGTAEGIALVFGLTVPRLFLTALAEIVGAYGQILWLSMFIYTIIPLLALFMMIYVRKSVSGDIFTVCQQLVGKIGAWFIMVTYIGMFFANSALILRQFAEYTLITALPRVDFQLVIIWYAITAGILCYLGIEALCRTGYIMIPFLIIGIIVVFILVSPFYVVYNLAPWQGNGIMLAIQTGIRDVGFNLGLLSLAFLSSAFQNTKTVKAAAIYALGSVLALRIVFLFSYIMVFGVNAGGEKAMPFFEMTRLVYLNSYIQHIESLFIVAWVIFGILAIAGSLYIGLYLIVVLLKLPALRPIVVLGVSIVALIAMLPPDIAYTIKVDKLLITFAAVGIYIFPGILFLMALVKRKRRKKTCTSS